MAIQLVQTSIHVHEHHFPCSLLRRLASKIAVFFAVIPVRRTIGGADRCAASMAASARLGAVLGKKGEQSSISDEKRRGGSKYMCVT